jgi:hypothetical protein
MVKPNTKISERPSLWMIGWIDLLDEVLVFLTSKGISPDFRDYQFLNLRLFQASIGENHEVIEQFVLILEFDL